MARKLQPRKVGRPATGKNTMIAIRWPRWLLEAIDRYGQHELLERPVALKQIVTKFLLAEGMVDQAAVRASMFPTAEMRPKRRSKNIEKELI